MAPAESTHSNILPDIPGYTVVQQIYVGSRASVYRAVERASQSLVVIKILQQDYPNFYDLLQFRNQYTIAKNLKIPGIVRPHSLVSYGNSYALIMEDIGGISLREYADAQKLDITAVLAIALQLADILHDLCQHRVIHKDIKPANIVIHPESKQVKLIDFSIASLLPRETQEIQNPNILEGTLAYLSPEQTGRMNRGIDYRSDFYSLGVTLYELFTWQLPFQSDDPMELVHCHLTKLPIAPHIINLEIPIAVSQIVLKLMAKNAEDRYQSALGLKYDLEYCLNQWQAKGGIEPFVLGQRDMCDRFLIPEKLYGRENEVQMLLEAFERISQGKTEIMLVAGFSGIGKTVVINEVHKPIVRQRGYFIKGKYDQFQRNIPFSAFVQAFRDLIRQLLSESNVQLVAWRAKILAALGDNGQVIVDVIPELESIIGQQPAVAELSGNASQNRFYLLLKKFIHVFTTPEHPLVMFLDDLQWADSASLNLLKLLINEANSGYLLILGAYRDNEVFPAHPLMLTLEQIEKAQSTVNTITLQPLLEITVNQLVANTLNCPDELAHPLSKLVYQRTKGNPFFTNQFLKALHDEGLLQFHPELGYWQCDMSMVRQLALTDDVVKFMALQLQKLPPETQEVLKLAACIGNQFDLKTLVTVSEKSSIDTATKLWMALQEGLILPVSETYKFFQSNGLDNIDRGSEIAVPYKFLHDRVQQAAYSLIPEEQKQTTHFQIGQLLLKETSLQERQEKLFEIVGQLNIGKGLITEQQERDTLAQLNWEAGEKAKAATAYTTAIDFFSVGIDLLAVNGWERQYELSLALYSSAAEVAYLGGDFERMEQLIQIVLKHAKTLLDQIQVYQTQIQAYQGQNQLLQAVDKALTVLNLLNIHFPEQPSFADIQTALDEVSNILSETSIENLIDLPCMIDPHKLAAIRILASVTPSVNQSAPTLMPLVVQKMISLSLQNGNALESTYAYATYGAVLCCVGGNIDTGYRFAQLGLNLLQRSATKEFQSRTYFIANFLVLHWKDHLRKTLNPLLEAYQSGLETGDLEHAAWAAAFYCVHAYCVGNSLPDLESEIASYSEVIRQSKQQTVLNMLSIFEQVVLTWLGKRQLFYSLNNKSDYLEDLLQLFIKTKNHYGSAAIHINQLILFYGFGDYDQAIIHAEAARKYLIATAGSVLFNLFHFYETLTNLAIYLNVDSKQQSHILEKVKVNQATLKQWANFAPENNIHHFDLVEAELHRVLGLKPEALQAYDRAIAIAKANGYIQDEALSNELAAKFYMDWGKEKIAAGYMQEAYYCYARWGAVAKTNDLEQRYPNLLRPILQPATQLLDPLNTLGLIANPNLSVQIPAKAGHSSSTSINSILDFAAILKASQCLASTIKLDELLYQLTHIILQHSGGDRCTLIRPNNAGEWQVEAIATLETTKLLSEPLEGNPHLPVKLIQYVKNTQQVVVINDLKTDLPVIDDYLRQQNPKSILCLPILNQGQLIGIVSLKNRSTSNVFTSDRVLVLNFLCTQAAISLANAHIYQESQIYAQQLEHSLEKLRLSETRFQKLADNVPGLIYQIRIKPDGSATVPYVSSGCQTLYGVAPEDLMSGKYSLRDFEHPDDQAEAFQAVVESAQNLTPFRHEWRIITPNGTIKWVKAASQPERREDGEVIWDGILIDITDRKNAEAAVIYKSQELEKALAQLQNTQLQMVQNEKMASLGNLVAGIAHEVNNPIGFLNGSIENAKDYIQDLFDYLSIYQQHHPNPAAPVQDKAEDIDLEFLSEDLPKLLDSMKGATDRISSISTSLRTFSRADTQYKVSANLHEGIDSTLLILKYRLKANDHRPAIQVIQEYGKLPLIECFPGQLNQVFMNILANAIDMFDDMAKNRSFEEIKAHPQQIKIHTAIVDNRVKISIRDNGKGMTEDVKAKIFDHLFTTKAVGKGTGLGLAIARQIVVEKHGGAIKVDSKLGEGTEFVIDLPL